MLNLNDITFNKRLGSLIGQCFEMPYVSYCYTLAVINKFDFAKLQNLINFDKNKNN